MPAAIPILVAELAVTAFGITDTLLIAVINIAATLASSAINYFLQDDKADDPIAASTGRQIMANTRDGRQPLKVVYGTIRVGGNDVYAHSAGSENKTLWLVQALAEGECNGIHQEEGVDQVLLGESLYTSYGNKVKYYFHSGSATQNVDSTLHGAKSEWTDPMRNTCYIVWKLRYDADKFAGLPDRTIVLEGMKIYDPRTGVTAYSNNPVLVLRDYLTNKRYGAGIDEDLLDEDSWNDGANYCDDKGWEFNGALTLGNQDRQSVVDEIKTHFRGDITYFNGKIYLRYADLNYESSCMTLLDQHISRDETGKAIVHVSQPGRFDAPDGLRVSYVDPDKDYAADELIIGEDYGVISNLALPGCTSRSIAALLGYYFLERMRLNRTITGVFRDDALKLEPYDVVTFSSEALGISSQLMRVREANYLASGQIELALQYENAELYDDDYDVDVDDVYECTLPQPTDEPPEPTTFGVEEEVYTVQDKTYVRLKLAWEYDEEAYPFVDYSKVQVSADGIAYTDYLNAKGGCVFSPTQVGETWYFKIFPVNIWGISRSTATERSYTVTGTALYPSNVSGIHYLINGNVLYLSWDEVSDNDIIGYEVRLGSDWLQASFIALVTGPAKTFPGIKPGTYTFLVCAKNSRGLYSQTPAEITVNAYDPFGYTEQDHFDDDFTGGTHDDTDRYNHPTYGYVLRVTPPNLTGNWESAVHDLGAVYKARVWIEYTKVTDFDTGNLWNTFFEEGDVWTDKVSENDTWMQLFGVESAGGLTMSLLWSTDNVNWSEVERAEIMSMEVQARYLKYRIYIENPNEDISVMVEDPCTLYAYVWA